MNRFLILIPLFIASCASHDRLQIKTVSVPGSVQVPSTDPAALMSTASKLGGSVRGWSVPIAADGTFALTRQKREFYPSAWDPPTAAHPSAQVAEYSSKLVGVAASGRVAPVADQREVQLSFQNVEKTGEANWGSGVKHPVYRSVTLATAVKVQPAKWVVVHEAASTAKDPNHRYLFVKAP